MKRAASIACVSMAIFIAPAGCAPSSAPPIALENAAAGVAVARPGFTSSWTVDLVNNSGSLYQLTALSIVPDDPGDPPGLFRVELDDQTATLPVVISPAERLSVRVFFSPTTLGERSATLQGVSYLADYRVGGGGCSTGTGRTAPEDALFTIWGSVIGTATSDAEYEDCEDGFDNDADGLIDCDDRDCTDDADCIPTEGCDPTDELLCGGGVDANTEPRRNEFEQYCGIATDEYAGPEEIWTFLPDESGRVVVTAAADGWDLDLILLDAEFAQDGTLECDPAACVARATGPSSTETVEFQALAGTAYFFVIDGLEGEAGPYELRVECGLDEEVDCDDGQDDDGDGLIDCDDPDCATSPDCVPSGTCDPIGTLGCGDTLTSANTGAETTEDVTQWCDELEARHVGPEIAWLFVSQTTGRATVRLTGLDSDLDVSALLLNPGGGGTCDPDLCVFDEPWERGTTSETISFDAFAGSPYVIAVDGWDGAVSSFSLDISCD